VNNLEEGTSDEGQEDGSEDENAVEENDEGLNKFFLSC